MTAFYTIQMSKHRAAKKLNITLLDTTVKSGNKAFAPEWDWVKAIKAGTMSEQRYTELYMAKIKYSLKDDIDQWLNLFNHDTLALACYCPDGVFCHRHLLRDFISRVAKNYNKEFKFKGEIG